MAWVGGRIVHIPESVPLLGMSSDRARGVLSTNLVCGDYGEFSFSSSSYRYIAPSVHSVVIGSFFCYVTTPLAGKGCEGAARKV